MTNVQLHELRKSVVPIFQKYGIKKAWLFGSRARGDDNAQSDYDFLISKGRMTSLIEYCGLIDDLENTLKTHVDVVSDAITDTVFLESISQGRIIIYEEQ